MKKISLLILLVAFVLSGCSVTVKKVETTTGEAVPETTSVNTTAPSFTEKEKTETASAVTEKVTAKPAEKTTVKKTESTTKKLTCTFSIECGTILDNMERLKESKKEFLPRDGVILKEITVCFDEGETVFQVLQRVCRENNIQLESSYTPGYDNYYIQGINQIYEKDCGTKSGWMYCVNGIFPNYGSSSYFLENGDRVEWKYTCDLGADIGDNSF